MFSLRLPFFMWSLAGLTVTLSAAGPAQAQSAAEKPAALPALRFASAEEGARELRQVDDFVSRLSAFDRQARLKTSEAVTQEAFLKFVGEQVEAWPEDLQQRTAAAWKLLEPALAKLKLPQVETVLIIRTTGREEGNAAYTRGRAIVLPSGRLRGDSLEMLSGLLAHEYFHVLSRADAGFRDRLYRVVGFEPCTEVVLPGALAARRLTNPDAPAWAHAIGVTVGKEKRRVVPILMAAVTSYPEGGSDEFFHFLSLRFWPLAEDANADASATAEMPALLSFAQLQGFTEQTGRNTQQIIHPEEILADNFKLILTGVKDVPSPELLEKIRAALMQEVKP